MPVYTMVTTPRPGDEPLTDEVKQRNGLKFDAWVRTEYTGKVLATYEKNGYDDSDFYAVVETDEPGVFTTVQYATTRAWTYLNGATVDATPEVVARYEAFRKGLAEEVRQQQAEAAKRELKVGATVTVDRPRSKKNGVTGVVKWVGLNQYGRHRDYGFGYGLHAYRVGVDTGTETVFVPADYVKMNVDGEWVEPTAPGRNFGTTYGYLVADAWRAPQTPLAKPA
jgi:hypothetical protein